MTSISQERANLDRVGLRLRRREEAGFRFDYTNSRLVDEPADHVFCHISVTNPGSYNSTDAHIRAIEDIGIARFGNTGFSYNRAITQDGTAYEGQPIGRRGAHTLNDKKLSSCVTSGCPGRGAGLYAPSYNLNVNARAYVIAQNVNDAVSDTQLDAVARCIAADMLAGHVKRSARIHGHRCVAWKDCPGGRLWARMGELEKRVSAYVKAGTVGESPQEDDMTPEQAKMLEQIHSWLSGNDQVARPYKSTDPKVSVRFGVQETWDDTHRMPGRVWSRRWPWRKTAKEQFPKTVKAYPKGYTMQALLQWSYIFLRRIVSWDWLVNTLGRAVWSRRVGGDGDMHGTRLGRADQNAAKAVAMAEANNALLATLIARDPGNPLTEEAVRGLFREAIENSMIKVDIGVSVEGEVEDPPVEPADAESDDDSDEEAAVNA